MHGRFVHDAFVHRVSPKKHLFFWQGKFLEKKQFTTDVLLKGKSKSNKTSCFIEKDFWGEKKNKKFEMQLMQQIPLIPSIIYGGSKNKLAWYRMLRGWLA